MSWHIICGHCSQPALVHIVLKHVRSLGDSTTRVFYHTLLAYLLYLLAHLDNVVMLVRRSVSSIVLLVVVTRPIRQPVLQWCSCVQSVAVSE